MVSHADTAGMVKQVDGSIRPKFDGTDVAGDGWMMQRVGQLVTKQQHVRQVKEVQLKDSLNHRQEKKRLGSTSTLQGEDKAPGKVSTTLWMICRQ